RRRASGRQAPPEKHERIADFALAGCGPGRLFTEPSRDIELSPANMAKETAAGRFGSGREVRRIEDRALLAGEGRFTDDISLPGQLHLCFLRSPHAHSRIVSIDATAARGSPGVAAILTG